MFIAPSANNLLNKLGSLNANKKLSALEEAPNINAKRRSLAYPNILLKKVNILIKLKDLKTLMPYFIPLTYLLFPLKNLKPQSALSYLNLNL